MGNNPAFSDEAAREQVERSHAYHRPKFQETMDTMGVIREGFKRLAHDLVTNVPASRERSLALTALDEGNMWAIAGLARHEPDGHEPNTTSHPAPQSGPPGLGYDPNAPAQVNWNPDNNR